MDTVFEALNNQDVLRNMLKKSFHVVQIRKQVNDTFLPKNHPGRLGADSLVELETNVLTLLCRGEEMRTRASEVRQKRNSNRIILASCADVKKRLRRNRMRFLYRDLLHQDLVADDEIVLRETAIMRWMDDVHF